LTPEQQRQVKPLLQEHHDKIQALFDKNPNASRQELDPQIHAISDETHRQIHALLSDHQKELEKAMQQREHKGEEAGVLLRLWQSRQFHLFRLHNRYVIRTSPKALSFEFQRSLVP
jgi:hypothetical protein